MFKWVASGIVTTALVITLVGAVSPSRIAVEEKSWESAESVRWADPAGARISSDLDVRQQVVLDRVRAKSEVIRDLIAGMITLDQAADRFAAINGTEPMAIAPLRIIYPDASDAELVYRQVVLGVRGHLRVNPARVNAMVVDLESKIASRFVPGSSVAPATVPVHGPSTARTGLPSW